MKFEGTLDIAAPRERVWAFLVDPHQVTACAPDVQSMEVSNATHFKVVVRTGVGPVKATFTMNVEFLDLEPPQRATVRARSGAGQRGRHDQHARALGERRPHDDALE